MTEQHLKISIHRIADGMTGANGDKAELKQGLEFAAKYLGAYARDLANEERVPWTQTAQSWENVPTILSLPDEEANSLSFQVQKCGSHAVAFRLYYMSKKELRGITLLARTTFGLGRDSGDSPITESLAKEDVFPCTELLESLLEKLRELCPETFSDELGFYYDVAHRRAAR
jgi:hypothetical protein